MKSCLVCATEKEDVSMVQVAPATWNGFHDFVQVCAECQTTRRFQMWAKKKKPKAGVPVTPESLEAAALEEAQNGHAPPPKTVQISHRRTGVLLQVVESHTLARASLSGANLAGADLQNAAMHEIDLHRADLHLADLTGADLRGADLRGVNLRGADLRGTDLRDAKMHRADVSHARYDAGTRWPADFDLHSSGALKEARSG